VSGKVKQSMARGRPIARPDVGFQG